MQFLNYKILDRPHSFVLTKDELELGYYSTLPQALQDLKHRYMLQTRTQAEIDALEAFVKECGGTV